MTTIQTDISPWEIRNAPRAAQEEMVTAYLQQQIAAVLDIDGAEMDRNGLIFDLDSIMLMSLMNKVSEALEIHIEAEELIDILSQLTIANLARIVLKKI